MRIALKQTAYSLVVLSLLLAGSVKESPAEPPQALGGLRLSHALQGEEAFRAIDRLHGKEVAGGDAYVAHYEMDGAVAMLYVSKASSAGEAAGQVKQMSERTQQGATVVWLASDPPVARQVLADLMDQIPLTRK